MKSEETDSPSFALFIAPILMILAGLNFYLAYEIHTTWTNVSNLRSVRVGVDQQIERTARDLPTAQSVESKLTRLEQDLLALGATNAEARKLLEKYRISPPNANGPEPTSNSSAP